MFQPRFCVAIKHIKCVCLCVGVCAAWVSVYVYLWVCTHICTCVRLIVDVRTTHLSPVSHP